MTPAPSRKHAGASVKDGRPPLTPRGLPVGVYHLVEMDGAGFPVREVPVRVEGWPYFAGLTAWA